MMGTMEERKYYTSKERKLPMDKVNQWRMLISCMYCIELKRFKLGSIWIVCMEIN